MNMLFSGFRKIAIASLALATVTARGDLAETKRLHFQGCAGDRAAAVQAEALLVTAHTENPTDPVVQAYLGSARLLAAARAWQPLRKLELCRTGGALLDGAVATAPDHLEIRFLRGASLYHLPGFFNKRAQAEADFRWVTERARDGSLAPELAAAAFYYDGLTRARHLDHAGAHAAWQTAVELAPQSKAGQDAAKKLAARRE